MTPEEKERFLKQRRQRTQQFIVTYASGSYLRDAIEYLNTPPAFDDLICYDERNGYYIDATQPMFECVYSNHDPQGGSSALDFVAQPVFKRDKHDHWLRDKYFVKRNPDKLLGELERLGLICQM